MELIYLLVGLLIGFIAAWFISRFKLEAESITKKQLESDYVFKDIYLQVKNDRDRLDQDLEKKQEEILDLNRDLSSMEQRFHGVNEKLGVQQEEVANLQQKFKIEFENIANRLFEEKSQKFTLQNKQQLTHLLQPFQEKIKDFEDKVEKVYWEESKSRISLKKEIEQLRELNMQLSDDAHNLANALKGESKMQGDWGEMRLELLLEKSGLEHQIHYHKQNSFKDDHGNQKRPDFIINLPENKHLIIDSKVSLKAYEAYYNEKDESRKNRHIQSHLESLKNHIKDLSRKNYQNLYEINSPDYVLLFVPIEPAFNLALQQDQKFFLDALDQNIVIVTTSTLLATLRTVAYIWKQEKQKRSVLEIARHSGLLYDKFCNFVDDLREVGKRLENAQKAYDGAMNKLVNGRGNLLGKAEKIRELGAKTSKSLPLELVEQAKESDLLNGADKPSKNGVKK